MQFIAGFASYFILQHFHNRNIADNVTLFIKYEKHLTGGVQNTKPSVKITLYRESNPRPPEYQIGIKTQPRISVFRSLLMRMCQL